MTVTKCFKCEKDISEIITTPMDIKDGDKTLKGAVYTCPSCNTIISCAPDPFAMADEIARRIV